MKKSKTKGITLIALIITIIVMLILVGVTVQILINSGLIETAQNAGDRTETAYEEEANLSEVEINGKVYNSIEDYFIGNEKIESIHNWQYTDNKLEALKCECETCKGKTYYISQQIKKAESDTLLAEGATPTGAEWVIFGAEDSDNNGTNETLLITTLAPSTETLKLGQAGGTDEARQASADAYINGPTYIENKVKEIYGAEARAMTIEDVNRTLGYEPEGGMLINEETGEITIINGIETKLKDVKIDESTTLMSKIVAYNNAECEGKFYTPASPTGKADGGAELGENYKLDGYYYYGIQDPDSPTTPYVPATTCAAAKDLVFNGYDFFYWLASRGVGAGYDSDGAYAGFGPGAVGSGGADSCGDLLNSYGFL